MKMNRGQTWSREETQCFIDIWSNEHIMAQLSTTHKNTQIFAVFSKQMREAGFHRSIDQCRVKSKKLRQQYIKVRDALNKTGSSSTLKDKFPWYDALDKILGTKPDVDPVDIVESTEDTTDPAPEEDAKATDTPDPSELVEEGESSIDDSDETTAVNSTATLRDESTPTIGRPPIPGSASRKRKKTGGREEDCQAYLTDSRQLMEEIKEAESRQLAQEESAFERLIQAQQEADERRFRAMQAQIQAQQQSSNEMIMQLVGTIVNAFTTAVPPSPSAWSRSSVPQPNTNNHQHHSQTPPHHHSNSDFYNL